MSIARMSREKIRGTRILLYLKTVADPDGSFVSTGACNLEVLGSNPAEPDICHGGCAYTVIQTVQRQGVYSAAYGTVHYKEPLKYFEIRVGHSPGFGLPFVAILP